MIPPHNRLTENIGFEAYSIINGFRRQKRRSLSGLYRLMALPFTHALQSVPLCHSHRLRLQVGIDFHFIVVSMGMGSFYSRLTYRFQKKEQKRRKETKGGIFLEKKWRHKI